MGRARGPHVFFVFVPFGTVIRGRMGAWCGGAGRTIAAFDVLSLVFADVCAYRLGCQIDGARGHCPHRHPLVCVVIHDRQKARRYGSSFFFFRLVFPSRMLLDPRCEDTFLFSRPRLDVIARQVVRFCNDSIALASFESNPTGMVSAPLGTFPSFRPSTFFVASHFIPCCVLHHRGDRPRSTKKTKKKTRMEATANATRPIVRQRNVSALFYFTLQYVQYRRVIVPAHHTHTHTLYRYTHARTEIRTDQWRRRRRARRDGKSTNRFRDLNFWTVTLFQTGTEHRLQEHVPSTTYLGHTARFSLRRLFFFFSPPVAVGARCGRCCRFAVSFFFFFTSSGHAQRGRRILDRDAGKLYDIETSTGGKKRGSTALGLLDSPGTSLFFSTHVAPGWD